MGTPRSYENVSELGQILAEKRKALGMTQRRLAERADVTQKWITDAEAGRVQGLDTTRMIRVAKVLGLRLVLVPNDEEDSA